MQRLTQSQVTHPQDAAGSIGTAPSGLYRGMLGSVFFSGWDRNFDKAISASALSLLSGISPRRDIRTRFHVRGVM